MLETSDSKPPVAGGRTGHNPIDADNGPQGLTKKNRNRPNRYALRNTRFEGKCESLRKYVYDVTLNRQNTDLFSTTTKGIAEYIATEYDDAGKYRTGLVDMELPELTAPDNVSADDQLNFKIWKLDMRDYRDKSKKRIKNNAKAFALILGQCSRTIQDRIEASSAWTQVNESSNVIGLLKLIRQSIFTGSTNTYRPHSLSDAEHAFWRFTQGDRMTNSDYLEKFKGLIEVIEHLGGEIGTSAERINDHMENIQGLNEEQEHELAKHRAKESYMSTLLLTKSDRKRYGSLIADLQNNHTRGNNGYPTTMSSAYDMLVNYKATSAPRFQHQDGGIAFYSDGNNGSNGGRGRTNDRTYGRGRGRGTGSGRVVRFAARGGGQTYNRYKQQRRHWSQPFFRCRG